MRRRDIVDDDSLPVMVPRSDMVLVPSSASRVRWLREHLIEALQELRKSKHPKRLASPLRREPFGFAASVARTACSLCKGWCCRNGGNDAFLDDRTLARVRIARPDIDEHAVLRLYLDRVPVVAYRDSCIFHGKQGCTLDRSLRADVCNSYYCGGLGAYMKTSAAVPTKVIAGEGDKMRTSPVLTPQEGFSRASGGSSPQDRTVTDEAATASAAPQSAPQPGGHPSDARLIRQQVTHRRGVDAGYERTGNSGRQA